MEHPPETQFTDSSQQLEVEGLGTGTLISMHAN